MLVSSCVAGWGLNPSPLEEQSFSFCHLLKKKTSFFVFHAALLLRGKEHITLVFAAPDSCGSPTCHTYVKKNLGFVTIPRLWR